MWFGSGGAGAPGFEFGASPGSLRSACRACQVVDLRPIYDGTGGQYRDVGRSTWTIPMLEPISPEETVNYYLSNREDEVAHETHRKHGDRLKQFLNWCDETNRGSMNDLTGRDLLEFKEWRGEGTRRLPSRTTSGPPRSSYGSARTYTASHPRSARRS